LTIDATADELELIALSDRREAAAAALLDRHRLVERLAALGEVHLVGSVALGVVLEPDVDLLVLVDEVDEATVSAFVQELRSDGFGTPATHWLGDGVQRRLACALAFPDGAGWQLDLCFSCRDAYEQRSPAAYLGARRAALSGARGVVLRIKAAVVADNQIPRIASNRIYDYVLASSDPTVDGFRAWLEETG
jgi:hypothetical protein